MQSLFGLRDNTHRVYTAGVDLTPAERVILSSSYTFERYDALSRSRQANPGVQFTDPSRNWATDATDRVHSVTASAEISRIAEKVNLRLAYDFSRARALYQYITGPVVDRTLPEEVVVPTTLPVPTELPPTLSQLARGTVDATYSPTSRVSIGLSWWHERYRVEDFTLDVDANPDLARGQTLLMGYLYRPYMANTAWGRLIVGDLLRQPRDRFLDQSVCRDPGLIAIPAVFLAGLLLIPIGMWREGRRRRRGGAAWRWPVIDLASGRTRQVVFAVLLLTLLNAGIVILASVGAEHYMETNQFCGQVCHVPMRPEFIAHAAGAHARVNCVTCHVSPGAAAPSVRSATARGSSTRSCSAASSARSPHRRAAWHQRLPRDARDVGNPPQSARPLRRRARMLPLSRRRAQGPRRPARAPGLRALPPGAVGPRRGISRRRAKSFPAPRRRPCFFHRSASLRHWHYRCPLPS